MTNPNLVKIATNILRRPGISKIAYDLAGLTVTGMRYSMVAKAIEDGKISCEAVSSFPTSPGDKLAPGTKVGAMYRPEKNTIYFDRDDYGSTSAYEQSVVLHEATHALFDLFATTNNDQVLAINDESAAVLAQAHWFRLCAPNDSIAIHGFSIMINGPGETSLALVDRMMAKTGDFMRDRSTYRLLPDETQKLRTAVAAEWNLVKSIDPDGGERDRSGIVDIYDGVVSCYRCWVEGS
jgi:hypothetical protein